MTEASHDQLASVVRQHAGQLAAALMRVTGDFATAEDLVQDAVLAALQHWPAEGIPDRPDAWLFTVARRRALDGFRRADNYRAKLAQLQWPVQPADDERLRLIFTCCHPALSRQAQIALTLRVVCGLTTAQIARAFLVHETAIAQRITRAKAHVADRRALKLTANPAEQAVLLQRLAGSSGARTGPDRGSGQLAGGR